MSARTDGFESILCTFKSDNRRIVLVDTPPYDMNIGDFDQKFEEYLAWLSTT